MNGSDIFNRAAVFARRVSGTLGRQLSKDTHRHWWIASCCARNLEVDGLEDDERGPLGFPPPNPEYVARSIRVYCLSVLEALIPSPTMPWV